MNTLPYLLTASLYLLLFYGCYALLLRRNTFFRLNRFYLLLSVGLSVGLPLVELPTGTGSSLPVGTITLPTLVIGSPQPESNSLTALQWLWVAYGLGVFVMLVRMSVNLWSVFRLIRRGTAKHTPAFTLVQLSTDATPSFSFGRYLVLNRTDALTKPDALMRHEEAHIHQRHTADVLFLEVVQAFFWFHPVLWLYKRALQEIHEFLADQAAVQQVSSGQLTHGQRAAHPTYAQQLVAYALHVPLTALTTPFVSESTLKQRIVMLQKPQTHRRALLGYVLALPLAALLTMCTQSEQEQTAPTAAEASARKPVKVDGEVFTVVEQTPEFPGGMKQLGNYLSQNLKYPEPAQRAHVQGKVFVSFIVTKTGEITNVQILKGIGFGTDAEAVRVVKNMPRWTPARQNGEVVNVKYNLPINFVIDEEAPAASNESAFKGIKTFFIDNKEVTEQAITDLPAAKIRRMDVDTKNGTIKVTTK